VSGVRTERRIAYRRTVTHLLSTGNSKWSDMASTPPSDNGRTRFAAGGSPMPALDSDIRLTLPARPENVAVMRNVIAALGEAVDLPAETVEDMRLAVTEACTNVVRHAYDAGEGRIEVVIRPEGDAIRLIVADSGRGIGRSPDLEGPGLGMPVMAALADSFEVDQAPGGGSRLRMSFDRRPAVGAA
jgi:serine/threonine-protein kinase RsbW